MKTLISKINKLGLLALVAAGLIITTQSAFTPSNAGEVVYLLNSTNTTYTRYSTDGTLPEDGSCFSVANYKPCTQRFNTANDPVSTTFSASSIPANNIPGQNSAYWKF